MQGFILLGFQNFVRERLGAELCQTVLREAGVSDRVYLPSQVYPGDDLQSLVKTVSRLTGMSLPLVLESFGDAVAGDFLKLYAGMINPKWNVLELLVHSEDLLGKLAMQSGEATEPSRLTGRWGKDGEVLLVYQSPLKICSFIKGLVRGLGANMEQPLVFDELRCVLTGATSCELAVKFERMQVSERPQSVRKRLTPPPMSPAAIKNALIEPPPPPASSRGDAPGWRSRWPNIPNPDRGASPPASGFAPTRAAPGSGLGSKYPNNFENESTDRPSARPSRPPPEPLSESKDLPGIGRKR